MGTTASYGSEEAAMDAYLRDGERRAFALGNRGPIRFEADGKLAQDTLDAYWRCGFYVFEGVLKAEELADIEADVKNILDRLPSEKGSLIDRHGRPALAADCKATTLFWSKPLGDPFGGTELANGRYPVKMYEPRAAADAPRDVVYLILGSLQFSEACLRVYGIDARRKRFPNERPFIYSPHTNAGLTYRWNDEAKAGIKDYNLLDLSI